MKCHEFEPALIDFARGETGQAGVRDEELAHANTCERCSARVADERSLSEALAAVAESHSVYEAPAGVEMKLLAAFRQNRRSQNRPTIAPESSARPARWRPLAWAAAAAAAVVLTIVVSAWLQLRPDGPAINSTAIGSGKITEPASTVASPPKTSESPSVTGGHSVDNHAVKAHRSNSRAKRDSLIASEGTPSRGDSEIRTDFMPLSYAQNVVSDGVQLVRVELPRSALASFGLPVNADRAGLPIKADVVLGSDGVAQAIRFVH